MAHLSHRDGKEEHTEAIDRPHCAWKMDFFMTLTNHDADEQDQIISCFAGFRKM